MPDSFVIQRGTYTIDADPRRLQVDVIHDFLANRSYWARGRSRETVEKSIAHSLCFGLYDGDRQVGFARLVTDQATFGWLCDVFILESHRGRGLGKWLVESLLQHPTVSSLRRLLLATRDAHELYRAHAGFRPLEHPEKMMERSNPAMDVPPLE
jgi:GNAT superfamily N-acetyltransferase